LKSVLYIFLFFILAFSCTDQDNKTINAIQHNTNSLSEVVGVVMKADTIKAPVILIAGTPKIIRLQ
jgi:hypothetical protein